MTGRRMEVYGSSDCRRPLRYPQTKRYHRSTMMMSVIKMRKLMSALTEPEPVMRVRMVLDQPLAVKYLWGRLSR